MRIAPAGIVFWGDKLPSLFEPSKISAVKTLISDDLLISYTSINLKNANKIDKIKIKIYVQVNICMEILLPCLFFGWGWEIDFFSWDISSFTLRNWVSVNECCRTISKVLPVRSVARKVTTSSSEYKTTISAPYQSLDIKKRNLNWNFRFWKLDWASTYFLILYIINYLARCQFFLINFFFYLFVCII